MKTITLDEYAEKIFEKEALIKEDSDTAEKIVTFSQALYERLRNGNKVKILTDYDCDGISSAFIMNRLIESIDSDIDVEVICNDRRGSYGVPPEVKGEKDTTYIILDMGSNQLDYIKETFGKENVFMIDHHLVEKAQDRDEITLSDNFLNPHSLHPDERENAQYCAAGLAYRVYQTCANHVKEFEFDYVRDNTVAIMAGIGTIGDVVDIMDMNSLNRNIVKDGMERINKATEDNIETPIGYILARNGIGETETNAKQIAFDIVSYINAASRMSEYMGQNGAQRMYNALTGDGRKSDTYFELDYLMEINSLKKSFCNNLQDNGYYNFITTEMNSDNTCLIYPINQDIEQALYNDGQGTRILHSMAGIIAGRISEATDKATLCFVYHPDGDYWSGSGRNAVGNRSLKTFIDGVLASDEGKGIEVEYGGHDDAIGISKMKGFDSLQKFSAAILANKSLMFKRDDFERVYLKMDLDEINTDKTLDTLMRLQPIGTGNTIPPVIVTGKLRNETKSCIIAKNPHWAKRELDTKNGRISVKDWNYNPSNYLTNDNGKTRYVQGETTFVATMDINTFRGRQSVELTRKTDLDYFKEYTLPLANKEVAKTAAKKAVSIEK